MSTRTITTREALRLQEAQDRTAHWKRWGPYLAERQWGTVREDYSPHGTAWDSFPHDHARSRAYRWGEDGIAGITDNHGRLCLALALWNGRDPILKERLFGLTGSEGNHGEDVKEYYFYLDSTPTHSYMKYLYKSPQAAFPYDALVEENRRRDRQGPEFELIDTGVFDTDRYFDVVVEYAKAAPDDILVRITATNRGPEAAEEIRPDLALMELLDGRPAAAHDQFRQLRDEDDRLFGSVLAEHALGHKAEAEKALGRFLAKYGRDQPYTVASLFSWRNERDQAFIWLDRALEQRDGSLAAVTFDPLLNNLRGDPRYKVFLRKMKLPE